MQNKTIEMADMLRQNGKLNVVIVVLAVIFLSIVVYLFLQDKRLRSLEKKMKEKNNRN